MSGGWNRGSMLGESNARTGADLEVDAVEGTAGVDEASWESLVVPGQGPLRHGFVAAWEHAELSGLRSKPLVARADGRIAAAAHSYLYDLDMAGAHSQVMESAVSTVRRALPRLLVSRVLELGSPTPLVNPFLCASDVPVEEAAEAVIRAALDQAREGGAEMIIAQNFERASSRGGVAEVLRRHGFAPVPIPPTVVVQLPFASFDEYLGAMRSQYRRRARKVIERSSHLEAEHIRDFAELAPELARLWHLVWRRAEELRREVLPEAFFRAVAELDYVSVLALRRRDGSLASYALLLEDEPWLHFLYTGFEEAAGEEEGAYFRLLYEIVRHAVEHGFPSVNLGMTTLEPKLDVGGAVLPLNAWIRTRRSRLQPLYVRLARGPFAPAPVAPRRVFKS